MAGRENPLEKYCHEQKVITTVLLSWTIRSPRPAKILRATDQIKFQYLRMYNETKLKPEPEERLRMMWL